MPGTPTSPTRLVVLGTRKEAPGQAWHLPSPETVTTREFVGTVFEEVGKPARVQAAPKILRRAPGIFNPPLCETIEMLYELEEPFVVDHSKFERVFGDHATPFDEAIRDAVRDGTVPGVRPRTFIRPPRDGRLGS